MKVACPQCDKHLRCPSDLVGKKVQCPRCKTKFRVQNTPEEQPASAEANAAASVKSPEQTPPKKEKPKPVAEVEEWFLLTDDAKQYGPMARAKIDAWHREGRVQRDCQIFRRGWAQWKWADEVYPDLAPAPSSSTAVVPEPPRDRGKHQNIAEDAALFTKSVKKTAAPSKIQPSEDQDDTVAAWLSGAEVFRAHQRLGQWIQRFVWLGFLATVLAMLGGTYQSLQVLREGFTVQAIGPLGVVLAAVLIGVGSFAVQLYLKRVKWLLRSPTQRQLLASMRAEATVWKRMCVVACTTIMVLVGVAVPLLLPVPDAQTAPAIPPPVETIPPQPQENVNEPATEEETEDGTLTDS